MVADENKTQRAEVSTALPDKKKLYEKLYSVIEENQKKGTKAFVSIAVSLFGIYQHELYKEQNYANIYDFALEQFRFLYKGIIIKHNKTEPTYTKTSLFLCEKRRFLWPGLRKEGNLFKLAGPGGLAFFHLTKKEVSKWPMKK